MPLFWLSLALILGIGLAQLVNLTLIAWVISGAGSVIMAVITWVLKRRGIVISPDWARLKLFGLSLTWFKPAIPYPWLFAVLCLGAARYTVQHPAIDPKQLAWYNDRSVEWEMLGVLAASPDRRDSYTNLRVRLEQIRSPDEIRYQPVSGLLLAQVEPGRDWKYGDRIYLRGELDTPPDGESFSYRDYLAVQGVYSLLRRGKVERLEGWSGNSLLASLYKLNNAGLKLVYRLYPDPEASLVAGILLGVDSGLPERVQEAFSKSGTAHIVAISG